MSQFRKNNNLLVFTVTIFVITLFLSLIHCDWPYTPSNQLQPVSSTPNSVKSSSGFFVVNPMRQICNPSASQDTMHFKGCMLFLNLGGIISVNIPNNWKSTYTQIADQPHDRLTITDTTNTVRWFMIKPSFIPETEIQDPEWSIDPDYIAFLGDNDENSSGYIVRISDKELFKFNNEKLFSTSTPYLWISNRDSSTHTFNTDAVTRMFNGNATWDQSTGMIDKQSVHSYFGTDSVKIIFAKKESGSDLSLYFIDYSQLNPTLSKLPRPTNRDGYQCESPLISPDGNWVVYNCKIGVFACESYLQRLSSVAQPILIHDGMAAEPHWWKNPSNGDLYILYCTKVGPIEDQLEKSPNDGSTGKTIIRKFNNSSDIQWLSLLGNESLLVGYPFQGGLTPDGHYIVTGYQYGYIYNLP